MLAAPCCRPTPTRMPRPPRPLALLLLPLLLAAGSRACTTIIVGRKATTDGSVLAARNVDYSALANITDVLFFHPPRKGAALYKADMNGFEAQLPGPGQAYFAFPHPCPATGCTDGNQTWEEIGINAAGGS